MFKSLSSHKTYLVGFLASSTSGAFNLNLLIMENKIIFPLAFLTGIVSIISGNIFIHHNTVFGKQKVNVFKEKDCFLTVTKG